MASLYLDHNVSERLLSLLHARGHAVTTTRRLRLTRRRDQVQLMVAAQRGLALVTHNRKDFVLLHDAWLLWSSEWSVSARHAGVLVAPQRSTAPTELVAAEIHALITAGPALANELYEWRPGAGWSRRQSDQYNALP